MKSWFNIVNKEKEDRGEVYIYGYIVDSKWDPLDHDVTPVDFLQELNKLRGIKNLDLFVNSGGGNVFAGMSIYHNLKRFNAYKTAYIDGISASITNVLTMACDRIIMPKTAMMLAHKPLISGFVLANANQLLELAAELDKVEGPIVEAYKEKTGLDEKTIKEILAKDSYMGAEDAVKLGFADAFDDKKQVKASIDGDNLIVNGVSVDISSYKNFPRDKFSNFVPEPPAPQPIDYSEYEMDLETTNLKLLSEVL